MRARSDPARPRPQSPAGPQGSRQLPRTHCRRHPAIDGPALDRPGTVIGPYKLLQQIGEGGFGIVYMAEQDQPVHRRVALKIIKPGMDSRQVVARLEAERQALAMMDHQGCSRANWT